MTIGSRQDDNRALLAAPRESYVPPPQGGRRGDRPQLAVNIVSLYILQSLNYAIPMAVLPYLVRVLGIEEYGLIAFAQSFAQYFTLLTDYGFNFSATRAIARQRDDGRKVSRIFCSVLLVKLSLMCLGALLLSAIAVTVPDIHRNAEFFFVAYLAVIGNVLFPVWYFQGMQKMRQITVMVGAGRLLAALALFVFVHRPKDALLALAIQSFGLIASGAIGLPLAFHGSGLRLVRPSWADLRATLAQGWHLFVSTAATGLYTNSNVFLVGLVAGSTQAGYFSAAEKLARAAQGVFVPASQAVFPHMSSLAAESRETALRFAARTLHWIGSISLAFSILIFLSAGTVTTLLFAGAASGAAPIIRWLALLPFLVAVSNVLGIQTLVVLGFDKQFSRILIGAGLFNVVLCLVLVRLFAAQGAGAAVLATEFLVTAAMISVLRRHGISTLRLVGCSA